MFSEESSLFLHLSLFEQEGKLRENCMIGHSDIPLEEKTVTICYGKDMTNIEFVNFVCASKEVAKVSCIVYRVCIKLYKEFRMWRYQCIKISY